VRDAIDYVDTHADSLNIAHFREEESVLTSVDSLYFLRQKLGKVGGLGRMSLAGLHWEKEPYGRKNR
jgi:hypothetical protein